MARTNVSVRMYRFARDNNKYISITLADKPAYEIQIRRHSLRISFVYDGLAISIVEYDHEIRGKWGTRSHEIGQDGYSPEDDVSPM